MKTTNVRPISMTKIVCTIGPASTSAEIISGLVRKGMSVARLNFSHGSHQEHRDRILLIRKVSEELNQPVCILQDLAGPKIRVGDIPEPGVRLKAGQPFCLTGKNVEGNEERVSVSYPNLPDEVNLGDQILLADGAMELIVKKTTGSEIYCEVITGGVLTSHKGINLPTGTVGIPALTDKDKKDLLFGLENEIDYVALSFVRRAQDILEVKEIMRNKNKDVPIIAKIENHEALDHIDSILEASDGIMVARGDLGVEIPLEKVPHVQKFLIRKANTLGKPVITATQMLQSMVHSHRPTRAEATDVANAVLDGTDAVMLSEETAVGAYPVQAVDYMSRIVQSAENDFPHDKYLQLIPKKEVADSVAHATCALADHLDATAIVSPTQSGQTARYISRFRPRQPIIGLSPSETTVRRLTLFWGCHPRLMPLPKDTDDMIESAVKLVVDSGHVSKEDLVVITSGHPIWVPGTTNMVRVKRI